MLWSTALDRLAWETIVKCMVGQERWLLGVGLSLELFLGLSEGPAQEQRRPAQRLSPSSGTRVGGRVG